MSGKITELELETEILDRFNRARDERDIDGIVRSLSDLECIGWREVRIVTRQIGIQGERIEREIYLDGRGRIVHGSGAFRLIWEIRFRKMIRENHHRWLKHQNEMSPEEWSWVNS